jgi:hypothetical protein
VILKKKEEKKEEKSLFHSNIATNLQEMIAVSLPF